MACGETIIGAIFDNDFMQKYLRQCFFITQVIHVLCRNITTCSIELAVCSIRYLNREVVLIGIIIVC